MISLARSPHDPLTPAIRRKMVERFNTRHPAGDIIRVWPGVMGEGPGALVRVREPGAVVLSGHSPVVYVSGGHGCIHLLHVRPVRPASSPERAGRQRNGKADGSWVAIPAVTLWQPWASLVAAGCKPWEFRGWPAPARLWGQQIAIHAAARRPLVIEMRALLMKLHGARWRETGLMRDTAIALLERWVREPSTLPLSAVLCLATLGEPVRNEVLAGRLGVAACDGFGSGSINDSERNDHSNWGWPLSAITLLAPYEPARGRQGFWLWRRAEAA